MKKEYQPGEFCFAKGCHIYYAPDKSCENCPYTAYDFHDWLIKNGYKIVREEEKE